MAQTENSSPPASISPAAFSTGPWRTPVWQSAPWYILGAGSIGCLFAAHLQRAGVDPQLILRNDTVAIEQPTLGVTVQNGDAETVVAVRATTAAQLHQPIKKILVCTKAQQTRGAIDALRPIIDPQAILVLLQNGMGVHEQLSEVLPQAHILHALTTEGAYQNVRFHIVHAGHGNTVIGALDPQLQDIANDVSTALQSKLKLAAVDNIGEHLWLKLAVNSAINPLTALHGCNNGELMQLPNIETILAALCDEVHAVAAAEGLHLKAEELIENIRQVSRATAANRSSMLQDLTQHRITEIDFINGYILQRARRHSIECPQQQVLFDAMKERERQLSCR